MFPISVAAFHGYCVSFHWTISIDSTSYTHNLTIYTLYTNCVQASQVINTGKFKIYFHIMQLVLYAYHKFFTRSVYIFRFP